MTEEEFKELVSTNIAFFRRKMGLTQLQLADKLNYSDKAISKWERGESLPDAYTLNVLAGFFGVSLNDFLIKHRQVPLFKNTRVRILISLISVTLVWAIATAIYVIAGITKTSLDDIWLAFIWAIPVSFIVLQVFASLWGKPWIQLTTASGILWGLAIALFITLSIFAPGNLWWLILVGAIPVEFLFVLWYIIKYIRKPKID